MDAFRLPGHRVLVTGASSGIGRDTAVLLSELGAQVILLGRSLERLEQTRQSLHGPGHVVETFDLTDSDAIPPLVKRIALNSGPLNGIVHAAGVQTTVALRVVDSRLIDKVMKTNVYAALMLARGLNQKNCAAVPASLVVVSSIMAITGRTALSIYSASKSALTGMVKSLALELAPRIRVNCVCPAYVRSEMTGRVEDSLSPEQFQALEALHPLGLGAPRDVSHAIAFLLSSASRWITGTSMIVDGGYTAQ